MTPTRFTIECDVARYALAVPAMAVEAWDTGEIFLNRVTSDVLAASLASCVCFIAKPAHEQTQETLIRLVTSALHDADAWINVWSEEPTWHSALWGPREVEWAVQEGYLPFAPFDTSIWFNALQAFFPFVNSEPK